MIQINGFDNKELNKSIKEKDRIAYTKVIIHPSVVQQIRERQVGEVVELFCLGFIPNKNPLDLVGSYTDDLNLPAQKFRQYCDSLIYVNDEITGLRKSSFIPYTKQGDFIRAFYSLELWNKLRDFSEENFPELKSFHEKVKELSSKLIETRKLLNQDNIEMVDASIEDLLSETLTSPWEIWKEYDPHNKSYDHTYFSKSVLQGKRRLAVLVSGKGEQGKIKNARCRRSYVEQDNNYARIYGAAYGIRR